ncbi:MAG: glycosyltransferase family 2 protein [Deltaproteobacteria bacterium]
MRQAVSKNISFQKKFPGVSVIIPTYNRAAYLKEAIESVLRQTYPPSQLIVVDDGSTDETPTVLSFYKERIKCLYQKNRERGAARNLGIRSSHGEYVAFLDSDDLWLPDHLKMCVSALEMEPDHGVAFSNAYRIDASGKIIAKNAKGVWKGDVLEKIIKKYSSGGCNSSSAVVRKGLFFNEGGQAGFFCEDPALSGSEDWEMWVRLASCTRFLPVDAYTVKLRCHPEQSSQRIEKMERSMTLALDLVFQNKALIPKIKKWKREGYSSLYTIIATNYYGSDDFRRARIFLKRAIFKYPLALFFNKLILYTFFRMLLGKHLVIFIRKLKHV